LFRRGLVFGVDWTKTILFSTIIGLIGTDHQETIKSILAKIFQQYFVDQEAGTKLVGLANE